MASTSDLIYGIKLNKAEELIDLNDMKLLSFCIAVFNGVLVYMVDKRRGRCRVILIRVLR